MVEQWHHPEKSGYRGSPMTYSDVAIQCALTLREVFHLLLRATQDFLLSLVQLLELSIRIPHYSTLSRRQQTLEVQLPRSSHGVPKHLVIDSTGLKVYGEGEWKVRQHGISKRRTWRKLHVAVDAQTQEVVAVELTANFVGDAEVLPDLLDQLDDADQVATVSADGAYDTAQCHKAIRNKGARALIPPREGAVEGRMTRKANLTQEQLLFGIVLKWVKKHGNRKVGIISEVWRKPPCFVSKGFLVTN